MGANSGEDYRERNLEMAQKSTFCLGNSQTLVQWFSNGVPGEHWPPWLIPAERRGCHQEVLPALRQLPSICRRHKDRGSCSRAAAGVKRAAKVLEEAADLGAGQWGLGGEARKVLFNLRAER